MILECLPEQFAFYHLGEIQSRETVPTEAEDLEFDDRTAIAFTLRGDLQIALILLVEPGLDLSMYSEAGNIIASKLATELANRHQLDVLLSAPARIQRTQLELLATSAETITRKTYVHQHKDTQVLLETLLFSNTPSQGGQA